MPQPTFHVNFIEAENDLIVACDRQLRNLPPRQVVLYMYNSPYASTVDYIPLLYVVTHHLAYQLVVRRSIKYKHGLLGRRLLIHLPMSQLLTAMSG